MIAKSFARIHAANLINAGILPLCFADPADYERITQGDVLELTGIHAGLESGEFTLRVNGETVRLSGSFSARQRAVLLAGGLLNYTREENA